MRAKLVRVGNSRGVRLPKAMIEEAGLTDEIELRLRGTEIVIAAVKRVREGWAEDAREMAKREKGLIMPYVPTKFDVEEWRWE